MKEKKGRQRFLVSSLAADLPTFWNRNWDGRCHQRAKGGTVDLLWEGLKALVVFSHDIQLPFLPQKLKLCVSYPHHSFFSHTHSIWEFLDWGLNLSCAASYAIAISLTHCAEDQTCHTTETSQIIKPMCRSGNSLKWYISKMSHSLWL